MLLILDATPNLSLVLAPGATIGDLGTGGCSWGLGISKSYELKICKILPLETFSSSSII